MNNGSGTLEEVLSRFTGALQAERGSVFRAGDIIVAALDDQRRFAKNPRELRRARGALLGQFASAGHCSKARCAQLAAVSATFGTEHRFPDVSWSLLRACLNAASRTGRDAVEILTEALANGWHVSEVGRLGVEEPEEVGLTADCPACGAYIAVRVRKVGVRASLVGMPLRCPVCCALADQDELHEAREVVIMGTLA